jgi:hypothetical protein
MATQIDRERIKEVAPKQRIRKALVPAVAGVPATNEIPKVLSPEDWQARQDELQAAHGKSVKRMLDQKAAEKRRQELALRRGVPTLRDELSEAVQSRMNPSEIPTHGNA